VDELWLTADRTKGPAWHVHSTGEWTAKHGRNVVHFTYNSVGMRHVKQHPGSGTAGVTQVQAYAAAELQFIVAEDL
jgi:hypothetical protein